MRQTPTLSPTLQAGGAVRVDGRRQTRQTLPARWAQITGAVVSFEVLFLLYVFAGSFKEIPQLSWFPVDITLFFFVLSVIGAVGLWTTRKCPIYGLEDAGMVLYVLFLSWTLSSLTWSRLDQFNIDKASETAILVSWCFLGSYLIVAEARSRVTRFVAIVMVISIAALSYWTYSRFVLGMFDPASGDTGVASYLTYGLHAQYLVAIFMSFAVASYGRVRPLVATLAVIAVLVMMLFIGGRGALLWALFIVPLALLFLLLNPNARSYRTRFLSVLLCGAFVLGLITVVVTWAATGLVEQLRPEMSTVGRLNNFSEPDYGASAWGRLRAQAFAVEMWSQAPMIGWGLGEFKYLFAYQDWIYPHNLFLEVLMEEGLVGFGLLGALMGLGLMRAWKLWPAGRPQWPVIALILMFIPLLMSRALHQGFLPDERALFAYLGLILGLGRQSRRGSLIPRGA
jgi:O-antigen ligase